MHGSLVVDILAGMRNEDMLMEAGVSAVDPHAPWLLNEVDSLRVMDMTVTYSRKLIADFLVFRRFFSEGLLVRSCCCPAATGDELHSRLGSRTCGALRRVLEEAIAAGNRELSAWYNKLWWPRLTWCRECGVALEECKCERVHDDMSVELELFTQGPLATLNIENTFQRQSRPDAAHEWCADWEARSLAQDDPCSFAT